MVYYLYSACFTLLLLLLSVFLQGLFCNGSQVNKSCGVFKDLQRTKYYFCLLRVLFWISRCEKWVFHQLINKKTWYYKLTFNLTWKLVLRKKSWYLIQVDQGQIFKDKFLQVVGLLILCVSSSTNEISYSRRVSSWTIWKIQLIFFVRK